MGYTTVVSCFPPAFSNTTQRDKQHTINTSGNEGGPPPQPQVTASRVLCSNDIKEQNNLQTRLPIHYQQHGGKLPTQRI